MNTGSKDESRETGVESPAANVVPFPPSSLDPQPSTPPAFVTKRWWQSKAILGGAVALISGAAQAIWQLDLGSENVGEVVFGGAAFLGGLLAIIGRVRANTAIGK